MKTYLLSVCSLILLMVSETSVAEIYQWKDENGKIQFSDSPPKRKYKQPSPEVTRLKITPVTQVQSIRPKEIDDYQKDNWKKREESARKQKKKRRQERERLAKKKRKNDKLCDKARIKYRQFTTKATGRTDLASLRKKREKRDTLKGKIKRYCR